MLSHIHVDLACLLLDQSRQVPPGKLMSAHSDVASVIAHRMSRILTMLGVLRLVHGAKAMLSASWNRPRIEYGFSADSERGREEEGNEEERGKCE
jgi:hypothetical protein